MDQNQVVQRDSTASHQDSSASGNSQNKKFKNKKARTQLGHYLFGATLGLIAFSFYSTYYYCSKYLAQSKQHSYMVDYFIPIFGILATWSYLKASLTSAGGVTIHETPTELSIVNDKLFGKRCEKCKIWKPPRAHHCSRCKKCIFKMDHHCEWLNNCVGYRNQKYFVLFLFHLEILTVCIGYTHLITFLIWLAFNSHRLKFALTTLSVGKLVVGFNLLASAFFFIFVTMMFWDQIQAIYYNQTAIEKQRQILGRSQPVAFTMMQIFGTNIAAWLIPTKPSLILNYCEVIYNQEYPSSEDPQYLEDQIYDEKSPLFHFFKTYNLSSD